jgi:hypothetical protein
MTRIDTKNKPLNWRNLNTHNRYMENIETGGLDDGCRLCECVAIHTFKHWKIVDNKYPYDRVALVHEMILPLRHTDGLDLTAQEVAELAKLKTTFLNDNYHFMVEALPKAKSIPGHFHLHLIVPNQA